MYSLRSDLLVATTKQMFFCIYTPIDSIFKRPTPSTDRSIDRAPSRRRTPPFPPALQVAGSSQVDEDLPLVLPARRGPAAIAIDRSISLPTRAAQLGIDRASYGPGAIDRSGIQLAPPRTDPSRSDRSIWDTSRSDPSIWDPVGALLPGLLAGSADSSCAPRVALPSPVAVLVELVLLLPCCRWCPSLKEKKVQSMSSNHGDTYS